MGYGQATGLTVCGAAALLISLALPGVPASAQDATQPVSVAAPRTAKPAKSAVVHRAAKPTRTAHRTAKVAPEPSASTTIPMDLTSMNRGVSGLGDPRNRPAAADAPNESGGVSPALGSGLTPGAAFAF